jgi:O-antigen/teichoic acid export membrane protein
MTAEGTAPQSSSRSLAVLGLGSFVNAACGVVLTFVLPRVTSIDTFGYWRAFLLYAGYAGIVHFGLVDGALVRWSVRDDASKQLRFRDAGAMLVLQHTLFALIGIPLVTTTLGGHANTSILVVAFCIYALLSNLSALWQSHFQGQFRFNAVAFAGAGPNLFFALSLPILYHWGFTLRVLLTGYLIAVAATVAVLTIVGWPALRGEEQKILAGRSHIVRIGLGVMSVGWPIVLANFAYGLMQSADRMTVQLTRPIQDFAIYSLAQSMIFVPVNIIAAITRVAFSHFARQPGSERRMTYTRITNTMVLLWFVLLPYFFVASWLIHRYIPKYIGGLPAGMILLLSVLFLGLISVVQANSFTLHGRQREYFVGSLVAVGVAFVTAWIGSRQLNSLAAVAWSQVITAALWWLVNEWALRRHQLFNLIGTARVLGTFALGCAGLYGAMALSAKLWMQIVLYMAIETLPAVLLFRAELSEFVSTAMRFEVKRTMPVG